MPFDHGPRLDNRQRIANAREKPIEANKNQSVDGSEGLFLTSGSPHNVYLLPQRQNFSLERSPRPKQICNHPNNEPDKISHPARASPDSRSTASQIEFAIGTTVKYAPIPVSSRPILKRCWARTTAGHSAAPLTKAINSRRLICRPMAKDFEIDARDISGSVGTSETSIFSNHFE